MVATTRSRSDTGTGDPLLGELIEEVSATSRPANRSIWMPSSPRTPSVPSPCDLFFRPSLSWPTWTLGCPRAACSTDSFLRPFESLGDLGDFRILREVGRGGMGVVYEAVQVARRRVALKVLPFAAAMDPTQLRRFQTEALAAAQLHHTNIVPVHSVGSERACIITRCSSSTARLWLRQLPSASGWNHSPRPMGRRYKRTRPVHIPAVASFSAMSLSWESRPPRLWTTPTRSGSFTAISSQRIYCSTRPASSGSLTWVWPGSGKTRMTMTGDMLGTLRYMSPEQSLAKRGYLDHRTDIYSLGVTLYELLTLRPSIEGQDRQEVLRKIAQEDPTPPRLLNPAVPRELDTILLKAMRREPGSRYATARNCPTTSDGFWSTDRSRPGVPRPGSGLRNGPGVIHPRRSPLLSAWF